MDGTVHTTQASNVHVTICAVLQNLSPNIVYMFSLILHFLTTASDEALQVRVCTWGIPSYVLGGGLISCITLWSLVSHFAIT